MESINNIINKYNNRFKQLIMKTILDINQASTNSALIKTGDLLRSIDSIFTFNEKDWSIDIDIKAIFYYEYLDNGTKRIKAFEITNKTLDSKENTDMIQDLLGELFEYKIDKIMLNK